MSDTTKAVNDPYNWVRSGISMDEELVALREKARMWDALENLDGNSESRIRLMTGLKLADAVRVTLAEAVKAAMEAEGAR